MTWFLPLHAEMSSEPAALIFTVMGLGRRGDQVWFTFPLLARHQERLLEEVLLAVDIFRDGLSACLVTAESGPLFGTQASAIVTSVRIGP